MSEHVCQPLLGVGPFTRRRFLVALGLGSGATLLAACGGPGTAAPTAAAPAATSAPAPIVIGGQATALPAATSAAAAAPTAAPTTAARPTQAQAAPAQPGRTVEITLSHIWASPPGGANKHPMSQVIDAFNAKNVGVKVAERIDSTVYTEILQKAQAEIAAGRASAIIATPWSQIIFADGQLGITNLEDMAGPDVDQIIGNMKPEVLNLVQVNGKTKGLPWALSSPVLYYNNDTLKSAGVDATEMFKDWPSYAEAARKVKTKAGGPVLGFGVNHDWPAQAFIQSNGGRVLDDSNQPQMDSPQAIEAMQMIADLAKDGLVQNATASEIQTAFSAGAVPTMIASIAVLSTQRAATSGKFEMGTSTFPVFPGKQRRIASGGSFLAAYARDKDQQMGALEFLKFASSEEGIKIWMQTGYLNSTKYTMPVLPGQEAAIAHQSEGLTRETSWPGKRGNEAQTVWGTMAQRIFAGDISAEQGCKQAKSEIAALIDQG
jgi:multiple sugar transport system substrate-binding protein